MSDVRTKEKYIYTWPVEVVEFVEKLMREGTFDGIFLDVVGARVWCSPQQDEWAEELPMVNGALGHE